jgi:hypothetical protein
LPFTHPASNVWICSKDEHKPDTVASGCGETDNLDDEDLRGDGSRSSSDPSSNVLRAS